MRWAVHELQDVGINAQPWIGIAPSIGVDVALDQLQSLILVEPLNVVGLGDSHRLISKATEREKETEAAFVHKLCAVGGSSIPESYGASLRGVAAQLQAGEGHQESLLNEQRQSIRSRSQQKQSESCVLGLAEMETASANDEMRRNKDEKLEASLILRGLASGYKHRGELPRALESYSESIGILVSLGDEAAVELASVHGGRGSVFARLGRHEEALQDYQAALTIDERIGDLRGLGASTGGVASVYRRMGLWDQAEEQYLRSIEFNRAAANQLGIASALVGLASVEIEMGRNEDAVERCTQAERINSRAANLPGVARSVVTRGRAFESSGRNNEAKADYIRARQMSELLQSAACRAISSAGLAVLALQANEPTESRRLIDEALKYSAKSGDEETSRHVDRVAAKLALDFAGSAANP